MRRVLIHGLSYFTKQFPDVLKREGWDIRCYTHHSVAHLASMSFQLHRCDLAYTWGGRISMGKFVSSARLLQKKKLVMFWCGSDVLEARKEFDAGIRPDPWIAARIHWAGAPWLADEVRSMGLACEYVPSTWVPILERPCPLPQRFSVLTYLPDANQASLYGVDRVLEVAQRLPEVAFTIIGLRPGQTIAVPKNVRFREWVSDMTPIYGSATVVWRPVRHDGLSFMALEALAHGRHVIWSYPFMGALVARNETAARIEIQRLHDLHDSGKLEINRAGMKFVQENFSPTRIRDGILSRWEEIIAANPQSASSQASALGVESS
jgi:hypothetical protein